ncbi:hypothetical protein KUH03_24355 [Sphingobacterium sp. E70]|uniref:hypothetical protein n=1 Tax=Sphingobacterium sp. E70 TaxID=2853439 RepID=UPI00211BC9A1|nr:hypothetical protein [Sphingobacterium sp. E70]ULT22518.1 hypothetical protein KUH03_24355 [Sphingobacterium sp. E70]
MIQQKEYDRVSKSIKNLEDDTKVSFDSVIAPLFNDEFALAELDNQDVLGLISISDSSLFANNFKNSVHLSVTRSINLNIPSYYMPLSESRSKVLQDHTLPSLMVSWLSQIEQAS